MGIRYRKRVKVAPGVYVNLSKSGASTTVKVGKGMSLNMGQNGTYLNSGIPGTGIYSRERIGGNKSAKDESNHMVSGDNDVSMFLGCGSITIAVIVLTIFSIMAESSDYTIWLIIASIVCLILFVLLIVNPNGRPKKLAAFDYDAEIRKVAEAINKTNEDDKIKKDLLSSYKECLIVSQKIQETNDILTALRKKQKPKYAELIKEKETEIENLSLELEEKRYDAQIDCDEKILERYSKITDAFTSMLSSEDVYFEDPNDKNIKNIRGYLKCLQKMTINFC